jgi:hypothetical protein
MRRLFTAAVLALPILMQVACGTTKEITVQRLDVQNALAPSFPMDKDAVVAKAQLKSPEVYFQDGGLGVKLHYTGRYMKRLAEGQIEFRGPLTYKPDRGAFFMEKVAVVDFTVNRENQANKTALQAILEHFVTEFAAETPVYRLDQKEFATNLSKLLVKSLRTWRNGMIVKFGS